VQLTSDDRVLRPDAAGPPYPAIVGYDPSSHLPAASALRPRHAGLPDQMRSRRGGDMPAPRRPIAYAPPRVVCERGSDGVLRYRSTVPLATYDPSLARLFRTAVEHNPGGRFPAERDGPTWRKLTYEAARPLVDALAASLVERGLSTERPVMILSANSIDHALLTLAGQTAGIPVAPISVAYSLQSQDHAKLKHIAALLTPGLVYVADTGPFAKALAALDLGNTELVASRNGANIEGVTSFTALAQSRPGPA